jgi:hypothetical protein
VKYVEADGTVKYLTTANNSATKTSPSCSSSTSETAAAALLLAAEAENKQQVVGDVMSNSPEPGIETDESATNPATAVKSPVGAGGGENGEDGGDSGANDDHEAGDDEDEDEWLALESKIDQELAAMDMDMGMGSDWGSEIDDSDSVGVRAGTDMGSPAAAAHCTLDDDDISKLEAELDNWSDDD